MTEMQTRGAAIEHHRSVPSQEDLKEQEPGPLERDQEWAINNQVVPQSEVYKAPVLVLEIIEGTVSPTSWNINACGLFETDEENYTGR